MVLSLSSEVYTKTIRNFILKKILNGEIKKNKENVVYLEMNMLTEHGDRAEMTCVKH